MKITIDFENEKVIIPSNCTLVDLLGIIKKALKVCPGIKDWEWEVEQVLVFTTGDTYTNITVEPSHPDYGNISYTGTIKDK